MSNILVTLLDPVLLRRPHPDYRPPPKPQLPHPPDEEGDNHQGHGDGKIEPYLGRDVDFHAAGQGFDVDVAHCQEGGCEGSGKEDQRDESDGSHGLRFLNGSVVEGHHHVAVLESDCVSELLVSIHISLRFLDDFRLVGIGSDE